MSCAARRHGKNVLCFECYRSRLDVPPERRTATVTLFPSTRPTSAFGISDPGSPILARQLDHRRRMLMHLTAIAPSNPPESRIDEIQTPARTPRVRS
jgi:hypothetical protein